MFDEPDLSQRLGECGVSIERQILTRDEDGSVTSPYAKVQSDDGTEMLVLLDLPGRIPLSDDEPMIMKSGPRDESIAPLLDQDVVGVSYVCEGNVCVKLGEQTQHLGEMPAAGGWTQIYPVVKVSNLIENPARVTHSAKLASLRLKEQSIINSQSQLRVLGTNLNTLAHEYHTFIARQRDAANQLMLSLAQLEQIKANYNTIIESGRTLSPVDQQKYDLVIAGLKSRNKLLNEMSLLEQKLAHLNMGVAEGIEKLRELNAFLANEFRDLTRV